MNISPTNRTNIFESGTNWTRAQIARKKSDGNLISISDHFKFLKKDDRSANDNGDVVVVVVIDDVDDDDDDDVEDDDVDNRSILYDDGMID
ncbi:hypothetical protein DERP_004074 [Dermatophagoides pteronyssinus]|uniref:Uncharacterized protein n=1 Tax=Dermatophagoides pteronyssinus TaxID=6956 RepID=A0ABQ8J833_DERPT|nr:hypothetical protein DERP_004074 [Dermatophagoides pteronyssinus]